jgi:hypothetical protein
MGFLSSLFKSVVAPSKDSLEDLYSEGKKQIGLDSGDRIRHPYEPEHEVGKPEWMWQQYQQDPLVQAMMQAAQRDWTGMFRSAGKSAADLQAGQVRSALGARGGGMLGSAVSLGAQARVGADLQGLLKGSDFGQQVLMDALTNKFNALTAVTGAKQGLTQSLLQYRAAKKATEAGTQQAWIQGTTGMIGNIFGKKD